MEMNLERIQALLNELYPAEQAEPAFQQIKALIAGTPPVKTYPSPYFSERTVTLITYGDTLQSTDEAPLKTLHIFVHEHLKGVIDTVHILPFYPFSSDDGFSVIDYFAVNPALGTWGDIVQLSRDFRLMFDAVINHMSAESIWFQRFLANDPEYKNMFITESPQTDLSSVTRPRTTPLLTPFSKKDGQIVHVWTTFSADQVDLNYRDPQTLLQIIKVLLFYIAQGAQVIRLDAIGYAWKTVGTSSIHLPETHAVVQLIRAVLNAVAPEIILITETNVPHRENVSYFGDGSNEAQLVYNFTLPPLLLHTLISGNANHLSDWLNSLDTLTASTAFFNFTASHDGIGVRPVEDILTGEEIQKLIDTVEQRGGRVSYRANSDGSRSPYELNIAYVDAVAPPELPEALRISCFLLSQAVMLSLAGVPAVYIHSLLGSHNNVEGVEETGQNRTINRAKLSIEGIDSQLQDSASFRAKVFNGYRHMLRVRTEHPAFHPHGRQKAFSLNAGAVLALERTAPDDSEHIIAVFNVTDQAQTIQISAQTDIDVLSGERCEKTIVLAPYQVRWLHHRPV